MEEIDFIVIITTITFLSIYFILGARHRITTIPWFTILRYPQYFGGWESLFRNVLWLTAWIALSNLIIILFCFLVLSFQDPVGTLYDWIGYQSPSGGKAGLATLTFFSVALYWHLVRKTHRIAKTRSEYMPKNVLEVDHLAPQEEAEFHPKERDLPKDKNVLRAMFYFVPEIMVPIYEHFFYSNTQTYIRGCYTLLTDKCGNDIVLG